MNFQDLLDGTFDLGYERPKRRPQYARARDFSPFSFQKFVKDNQFQWGDYIETFIDRINDLNTQINENRDEIRRAYLMVASLHKTHRVIQETMLPD